jgi:glycosyltransferase involved in cell wall biosynthesis
LKLFLVTNNFPPVIDGVGDYSFELFKHLTKNGNDVKVITSNKQSISELFASRNNVLPIVSKWGFSAYLRIAKLIKEEKIEWLCLQYVPYAFSKKGIPFHLIWLLILCRLNGCKTLVCFHEVAVRTRGYGVKSSFTGSLQRLIAYGLCFFSNKRITSNLLYASYLKPFALTVTPVPANLYIETDARQAEKSLDKKIFTITSFANRCDKYLLQAISDLKMKTNFPFRVVLAGHCSPTKMGQIQLMGIDFGVKDFVEITGEVSKETMAQLLADTDIYVQTEFVSKRGEGGISGKSGAVAAAMCAGAAIITTKGDMTDAPIFADRQNVLFVAYQDAANMSEALEELGNNDSLRNQLKKNARQTYENNMSWQYTAIIYQQALNKAS